MNINRGFYYSQNSDHKIFLCENVFDRVIQVELLVFDN